MTSLKGCAGGGWTMVMKINGKKVLFRNFELHYSLLFSGDCQKTCTEIMSVTIQPLLNVIINVEEVILEIY
jgi:hypothetical protein